MSFYAKLNLAWEKSNSLVCVGLDPDLKTLPTILKTEKEPIFTFNKALIDATADLVCAYKPQIAFYSGQRAEEELRKTFEYMQKYCAHVVTILDAKRGDIGSTAQMYAREAFEIYGADSVTINPYLGGDSIQPFTDYQEKGSILLCRTSNPGGSDLQNFSNGSEALYQRVAKLAAQSWNSHQNVALVVGATFPEELKNVRSLVGDTIPILVPGVGAQGGNAEAVVKAGQNSRGTGLIINSSRAIIYASSGRDFASAARTATLALNSEINSHRGS